MWELGKPTIARVRGWALAGGFGLALACDLVIAADDARFGTPEIDVGLWPFMTTVPLCRSMPPKRALELMMTGRRPDVDRAGRHRGRGRGRRRVRREARAGVEGAVSDDPLAPLRMLIGSVVARIAALSATVRGTEAPARRRRRWDPVAYRHRWDEAVRRHRALTGAELDESGQAVTQMVQQASWLAESVPGFADDPRLLVRAIDEIIRVGTGFGAEGLASAEAQRLWYEAEAAATAPPRRRRRAPRHPIRRASDQSAMLARRAASQAAWEAWAADRLAIREREGG
jgi:hypothetical protein